MQIRKDIPSKMYHYTSLESLCSIVENQEFWLGDTRQMNDYNEALELLNITKVCNTPIALLKNSIKLLSAANAACP